MSLRWRDEVRIRFGTTGIALARHPRGWRRPVELERTRSVEDGPLTWARARDLLREELQHDGWGHANANVVVADRWARYAVLPWSAALTDEEEQLAHGRLVLRQVYGDDLAGWTVRLSQASPGRSRLVCALPTQLIEELRHVLATVQLRLASLQPGIVDAYNRWRARLPDAGAWFVTVDAGHMVAVRTQQDAWVEIHGLRAGPGWPAELGRLRALERLANPGTPGATRAFVDVPPAERDPEAGAGQGHEWLDLPTVVDRGLTRLGRLRREVA